MIKETYSYFSFTNKLYNVHAHIHHASARVLCTFSTKLLTHSKIQTQTAVVRGIGVPQTEAVACWRQEQHEVVEHIIIQYCCMLSLGANSKMAHMPKSGFSKHAVLSKDDNLKILSCLICLLIAKVYCFFKELKCFRFSMFYVLQYLLSLENISIYGSVVFFITLF